MYRSSFTFLIKYVVIAIVIMIYLLATADITHEGKPMSWIELYHHTDDHRGNPND